jgi:hypothetical protein
MVDCVLLGSLLLHWLILPAPQQFTRVTCIYDPLAPCPCPTLIAVHGGIHECDAQRHAQH